MENTILEREKLGNHSFCIYIQYILYITRFLCETTTQLIPPTGDASDQIEIIHKYPDSGRRGKHGNMWADQGPYSTVYSTVAMEGSPGTVQNGGHGVRPGRYTTVGMGVRQDQYSAVTMRETRGRTVQ